jgi:hypothetical protein
VLFDLELLGEPIEGRAPTVIDRRTHGGATVQDAAASARFIVLNTPVPGTYGFRLLDSQTKDQVHIWWNLGDRPLEHI